MQRWKASTAPATGYPNAPMTDRNPYDDLIQQDTAQALRASMSGVVDRQPDAEARLQNLARDYNMPVEAVRLRQHEIERTARLDALDYDTLARQYPKTAGTLTDPNQAAIAHDDVANMSAMERIGGGLKATVKYIFSAPDSRNTLMGDIGAGVFMASRGAAGAFRAGAEALAPALDVFERRDIGSADRAPVPFVADLPGGNPLRRLAEGFDRSARAAGAIENQLSPPSVDVVQGGVSSGVKSLVQNTLNLPLAFLPGGQAAYMTAVTSSAGGQSYQKAREKGVDPVTSLIYGASDAVIEYGTERIPVARLLGDLKAGAPFMQTLLHNAMLEVPGEQAATVLQDLNEWAVVNPDKPFSTYLEERPAAAAQTLIATLVGVGGSVSVGTVIQKVADSAAGVERDATRAEAHAKVLGELLTLAEASKVRERDPASFATFMQSLTEEGVPNVYVDAKALRQAVDINEVASVLPSVAEQIEQAEATGGDVVIPTAELLTAGPGQTFMQHLLDNARTAPDAMSPVEAREYMQAKGDQLAADIQTALGQQEQDQSWRQMRDDLRDEIKAQLDGVKRFTADVNLQYANLLANFYAVTAAKLGQTPQELANRYGLLVQSRGVEDGQVLDQRAYHGTPYRGIDKFSTDNIGTGEGNQAFGWGLYFAGKKEVADYYSKTLGESSVAYDGKTLSEDSTDYTAAELLWAQQGDKAGAKDDAGGFENAKAIRAAIDHMDFAKSQRGRQLYEVEIPEDSDMLIFDKPITSQPDKVKQILKASGLWKELKENLSDYASPSNTRGKLKGENIYAFLAWKLGSEKAASQRLQELGIPGMTYPGGTISGVKSVGHNYVIFSGESVEKTGELYQSTPLPDTIEIDGKQRPTTNSNGQPIAQTEEGVRNFWKWFGDSKMVDAEGRPQAVYHGTKKDFKAFKTELIGSNFGVDKHGFFFTGRPVVASGYADPQSQGFAAGLPYDKRLTYTPAAGANVMPAYLSLQNPLTLEQYTWALASTPDVEIGEPGVSLISFFDESEGDVLRYAIDNGHDGVFFQYKGETLAIAFRPEQIKSATGNNGEFDPASPSVLRQEASVSLTLPDDLTRSPAILSLFRGADL